MATTKPATKTAPAKTAPAAKTPRPGTALMPWEAQMKATAVAQAAGEKLKAGVARINIANGRMMIDDQAVEGNSLDVVVIGAVHLNEYYSKPYDPRRPAVPDCYAYSLKDPSDPKDPEADMAPSDDVEDQQNTICAECEKNVMGSADVGRGKACKNVRRLLVVTEDALESAETLAEAEERSLSVPVMSTFNWARYVKTVLAEELERPYFGVVTTVSVVPDAKSQFKIEFAFKELINFDQDLWDAMQKKVAGAYATLTAPYPKQAELDAANGPAARPMKPVGKAAQMMQKGKPAAKGAAPAPAAKKAAKY